MADTRLNLTPAAKAAGVTRRTFCNHINQGKVTASRDEKNNPVIDVSELIRIYGNVSLPVKNSRRFTALLLVAHGANSIQESALNLYHGVDNKGFMKTFSCCASS